VQPALKSATASARHQAKEAGPGHRSPFASIAIEVSPGKSMATMLIDRFANSDKKPDPDDCSWNAWLI
jgi:hypothetical protein